MRGVQRGKKVGGAGETDEQEEKGGCAEADGATHGTEIGSGYREIQKNYFFVNAASNHQVAT